MELREYLCDKNDHAFWIDSPTDEKPTMCPFCGGTIISTDMLAEIKKLIVEI